jgi:hypothetical protein
MSRESPYSRQFTFIGGDKGIWCVVNMETITGASLAKVERLDVTAGQIAEAYPGVKWFLRGITSNERYITRVEKDQLIEKQPALGRPQANCAALIPIRKTAKWWSLPQDERRRIFEESSKHVKTGLKYLPVVARRLHHCRDLGENEPFDFLTWFEFASSDTQAFNELVSELRTTEEWTYIEREIDIRVIRDHYGAM